jgi:hypothetical protein
VGDVRGAGGLAGAVAGEGEVSSPQAVRVIGRPSATLSSTLLLARRAWSRSSESPILQR